MAVVHLLLFVVAIIVIKLYFKLSTGWCNSYVSLVGKTAIVSGANSGIGYWTALDFAKRGCKVILACRNKYKAEKARQRIIHTTGNHNVHVQIIDMESLESVRNFAKEFNEREEKLDILVNNAGGYLLGDKFTKDNLQITMQVNFFSHVLLTELLLDKLEKSGAGRVVNVSSIGAKYSDIKISELNSTRKRIFADSYQYMHSKLCLIFYTVQLAKRLERRGITVNTLHPGPVETEIIQNTSISIMILSLIFLYLFVKSPEEGAQTSIYAAVSKDMDNVTGKFLTDCKVDAMYRTTQNEKLGVEVWEQTRKLLNLSSDLINNN